MAGVIIRNLIKKQLRVYLVMLFCLYSSSLNASTDNFEKKVCPNDLKQIWARKMASSLNNYDIFNYVKLVHGKPLHCFSKSTRKTKILKIFFAKGVMFHLFVKFSGATWVKFISPSGITDVNGIFTALGETTRNLGLRIDWNRYRVFERNGITTKLYCDDVNGTGLLSFSTFEKHILTRLEYGFLEHRYCPTELKEIEKLIYGK